MYWYVLVCIGMFWYVLVCIGMFWYKWYELVWMVLSSRSALKFIFSLVHFRRQILEAGSWKNRAMNINSKKIWPVFNNCFRGVMVIALDFQARHCRFESHWGKLTFFSSKTFLWMSFCFYLPLYMKNLLWHHHGIRRLHFTL